jgi:hypothetical protein
MIYRGPGFLAVVWFGFSPYPLRKLSVFLSLPVYRRSSLLTGKGDRGWVRSQIIRQRECLILCKIIQYSLRRLTIIQTCMCSACADPRGRGLRIGTVTRMISLLYKNLFPKIILPHMYLKILHLFYFLTANCTFERLALLYLAKKDIPTYRTNPIQHPLRQSLHPLTIQWKRKQHRNHDF